MNKQDLKENYIYRIKYDNPYSCGSSYDGTAIYRLPEWNDSERELIFDLLEGSKDKGCIFYIEDVVEEVGRANEPISFNPDKITRIVVVGEGGREFEKWFDSCEVSLQDDGRTLKIFYAK